MPESHLKARWQSTKYRKVQKVHAKSFKRTLVFRKSSTMTGFFNGMQSVLSHPNWLAKLNQIQGFGFRTAEKNSNIQRCYGHFVMYFAYLNWWLFVVSVKDQCSLVIKCDSYLIYLHSKRINSLQLVYMIAVWESYRWDIFLLSQFTWGKLSYKQA